ncbi:MAG: bifunctional DNA-formamidopyrimidine glycosylase/DNA-(apurinic or apyrimidinic site) lyase [Fibrobacterota bacterium]
MLQSPMPELPEVETVRRGLQERLPDEIVASVEVRHPSILEDCEPGDLGDLSGFRFARVDRRAKYLLLRMESGEVAKTLVVHLGMTGQLTWKAVDQEVVDKFRRLVSGYRKSTGAHSIDAHTHLVVRTRSGGMLLFRDPRRFGRILLLDGSDENCPRIARLGPDAWRLDARTMAGILRARSGRRCAKAVLLDQSVVAGIGNIYADEACFLAGIRPEKALARLSAAKILRLAESVDAVLEKGVVNAGTSFRDFVGSDGETGSNQEDLAVYGRGGLPCRVCGRILATETVAQRTTVWCPKCQS